MSIYTKKGDKGQTGLPGDRRLSKTDQLFETLGYFDQTSAFIGLAISFMDPNKDKEFIEELQQIQSNFLALGACLASEKPEEQPILAQLSLITDELEAQIDIWDDQLPALRNFILAGGSSAGATLHLARASTRHAERQFHRLNTEQKRPEIAQYLNRLSDFFFQAARFYNHTHHQPEITWKPHKQN